MAALQFEDVRIGRQALPGTLVSMAQAAGIVMCAIGRGGCLRLGERGVVPDVLHGHRLATLLLDLPGGTAPADKAGDVDLLGGGVREALEWQQGRHDLEPLPVGLLGAGSGSAAVLRVAAERPGRVGAVVSCGGHPGPAIEHLPRVLAPTLLIVGGHDLELLDVNRGALRQLRCRKRLEIVPAATRRFEEPGALEAVAHLAGAWFANQLPRGRA